MMKKLIFLTLVSTFAKAGVEVGKPLPPLTLSDKEGGRVDGTPFSSDVIKDKVFSVFYVSPVEREKNEPLEAYYKQEKLPFETHASVAIINMAAAWYIPNNILEYKLKKKQEEFPRTIYVKDLDKKVVKEWDLADKSVNVMVVSAKGIVLWVKKAPVEASEFADLMKLIRSNFKK